MSLLEPPPVPELSEASRHERRASLMNEVRTDDEPVPTSTRRRTAIALTCTVVAVSAVGAALVQTRDATPSGDTRPHSERLTTPNADTRAALVRDCRASFQPVPTAPDAGGAYPQFWSRAAPVLVNTVASDRSADVVLYRRGVYATCTGQRASGAPDDSYDTGTVSGPAKTSGRPSGSTVRALQFPSQYDPNHFANRHTSWVIGRSGPDVATISLHLRGNVVVRAALGTDGWWHAWTGPNFEQTAPASSDHLGGDTQTDPIDVVVTDRHGKVTRLTLRQT